MMMKEDKIKVKRRRDRRGSIRLIFLSFSEGKIVILPSLCNCHKE